MLIESVAVTSLRPEKIPSHFQNKDVGISFYDFEPSVSLRSTLKKSSAKPNCLAINSTHAFAAQADKAAVHVYNLSKGTQECLVPFPEQITSLAIIGEHYDLGILALGTQGGNVIFWELATGRQVVTPAAHLQSVECMVADPCQNYLITGSPDSNVLVWSVSACLSFASFDDVYSENSSSLAPVHTLSNHRGPVTCLATGHSFSNSNFVISGSEDRSCIVWDYRSGQLLHTFLLGFTPLCLAVDPVDRAFYAGCSDGGIQLIDFHKRPIFQNVVHSSKATDSATEADTADKWSFESAEPAEPTEVLAIALSYDGTRLLSGHQNGQLYAWSVATGRVVGEKKAEVLGPLTNIVMRPIKGLRSDDQAQAKLIAVVKPKRENISGGTEDGVGLVPETYALSAQFHRTLTSAYSSRGVANCSVGDEFSDSTMDEFDTALSHVSLPAELLEVETISILGSDATFQPRGTLSSMPSKTEQELKQVRELLAASSQSYLAMKDKANQLTKEVLRLRRDEQNRLRRRRVLQARRLQHFNGGNPDSMDYSNDSADGDDLAEDARRF